MMSVVPFSKTSEGKQKRSRSRDKATRAAGQAAIDAPYKRKLIAFDAEAWHALHLLARDTMKDIQELADEAFADVLKKYHRPTGLKEALRQSAREQSKTVATNQTSSLCISPKRLPRVAAVAPELGSYRTGQHGGGTMSRGATCEFECCDCACNRTAVWGRSCV
jgi:Lon protease-like protein